MTSEKRDPMLIPTVSDVIQMSDGSTIPNTPEAIERHGATRRKAVEETRRQYEQRNALDTGRFCPFQYDDGAKKTCKRDCALYALCSALTARHGTVDTNGKPCPFQRRCDPSCALYNGAGCTLNTIIKE